MSSEGTPTRAPRWLRPESWPLAAAGLAVLVTLVAVHALLHPRRLAAASGSGEDAPASVTVDAVELRSAPNPRALRTASLSSGARLRVVSDLGRWLEIETEGRRGYLPGDTIERDADRVTREHRAKQLLSLPPVYGVVAADTDVGLAPYPLAARGGRLSRGSVIAIHSVDHSYFAFEDKTWGIAFVSSADVDLVPPDPRLPAIAPEKTKPLKDLTVVDLTSEPPPEEEPAGEDSPFGQRSPRGAPPAASSPEGAVESPVLLSRVEPDYPEAARRAGAEGTVELEISIDASGRVTGVDVVRGLPLGLSEAAADAVRRWTYRPARTRDGPIAARKIVRIHFMLTLGEPR